LKFLTPFRKRLFLFFFVGLLLFIAVIGVRLLIAHQRVERQVKAILGRDQMSASKYIANKAHVPFSLQTAPAISNNFKERYHPLFPENTPLATIVEELKLESDRGNALASCRLATELMRCDLLKLMPAAKEKILKLIELGEKSVDDKKRLIKVVEKYGRMETRDSEICRGFVNEQNLVSADYLFSAALAGHEPSMELYALTPPDIRKIVNNPEALVAYRQYSTSMIFQLAQRGNRRAASTLSRIYQGDSFWNHLHLPAPVALDHDEAAVWAYAGFMIDSDPTSLEAALELPRKYLSPERLKQAQDRALAMSASFAVKPERASIEIQKAWTERSENGVYGICK
jgi:hypothetical protein